MKYVTRAEMREIDRITIEDYGVPAITLMENAGRCVALEAAKLLRKGKVAVFSGYGNNGGDGFVAARYLLKKGYDVKVYLVGKPKPLSHESNNKLEELMTAGLKLNVISDKEKLAEAFKAMDKPDLVIDAIFGIGLKDTMDSLSAETVDRINSIGAPVVSIDIPSGLDADTGKPLPRAIKASITVAIGYPKAGYIVPESEDYVGRLFIADIGLKDTPRPSRVKEKSKEKAISIRTGNMGKLRPGHPWIFKQQLRQYDKTIKPGEVIAVVSADNKFIGRGYFNPQSEISIRLLTFKKDELVNKDFFLERMKGSIDKRRPLLSTTNAYKAIFSEADGLPGLIVDVYADTAVFQVLTLGMERFKDVILEGIKEYIAPKYIYEKSESNFRKLEGLTDISQWHGEKGNDIVEIREGKVKFLVNIIKGHKTGFYLDQRRARISLENFVKGKKVLDLFCYTGGFSVTAACYGAAVVRGIDIKEDWLEMAAKNAVLNGVGDVADFEKGDVFDVIREIHNSGERFDIIILDPPSFLRSKSDIAAAARGYKDLNLYAMKTLVEGGMLCTFSCSHNMPNNKFAEIIKSAARDARKKTEIVKRCHQADDHPIVRAIPETEYLKGYFLKVTSI
jgi:23S rRNA (cytosine1962-C5)-methyltransferase